MLLSMRRTIVFGGSIAIISAAFIETPTLTSEPQLTRHSSWLLAAIQSTLEAQDFLTKR